MNCGLCYQEQNVVLMGISNNLVEFDLEKMKIIKNVITKSYVWQIEKVNDKTFLVGEWDGYLELINKEDLTCLSCLRLNGVIGII